MCVKVKLFMEGTIQPTTGNNVCFHAHNKYSAICRVQGIKGMSLDKFNA
jgi:hypothetical protein